MALYSLIADITPKDDRPFRLGMLGLGSTLASPIGPVVGANIFASGGYVAVMATSFGLTCIAIVVIVWQITKIEWKPSEEVIEVSWSFQRTIADQINICKHFRSVEQPPCLVFNTLLTQ